MLRRTLSFGDEAAFYGGSCYPRSPYDLALHVNKQLRQKLTSQGAKLCRLEDLMRAASHAGENWQGALIDTLQKDNAALSARVYAAQQEAQVLRLKMEMGKSNDTTTSEASMQTDEEEVVVVVEVDKELVEQLSVRVAMLQHQNTRLRDHNDKVSEEHDFMRMQCLKQAQLVGATAAEVVDAKAESKRLELQVEHMTTVLHQVEGEKMTMRREGMQMLLSMQLAMTEHNEWKQKEKLWLQAFEDMSTHMRAGLNCVPAEVVATNVLASGTSPRSKGKASRKGKGARKRERGLLIECTEDNALKLKNGVAELIRKANANDDGGVEESKEVN